MFSDKLQYEKYNLYSAEDFLQDEFFIASMIHPTDESRKFWNYLIDESLVEKDEIEIAICIMSSIRVKPERIPWNETMELWGNIEMENKGYLNKKSKKLRLGFLIASACFLLLLSGVFFVYTRTELDNLNSSIKIEKIVNPNTQNTEIQLVLSEKETVSLDGVEAEIQYKEDGLEINNQKKILNSANKSSSKTNQLIVPFGKRSMLTLSDGSKMWINSGSNVTFPVVFDKKKREIYVDGEVFLEIVSMKGTPFVVNTKRHKIEVLGTSFNLTAYERDSTQSVVLVSGLVKIQTEEEKEISLSPSEMYIYENGHQQVKKVNVDEYISWKNGVYQYRSEELGLILKRLSRYYGDNINCSEDVYNLKCSGKLDLKDDLEIILRGISSTVPISYEMKNGIFVISRKE